MQSWIVCSNKVCHLGHICFHGYQHRLELCSLHGYMQWIKSYSYKYKTLMVSLKFYKAAVWRNKFWHHQFRKREKRAIFTHRNTKLNGESRNTSRGISSWEQKERQLNKWIKNTGHTRGVISNSLNSTSVRVYKPSYLLALGNSLFPVWKLLYLFTDYAEELWWNSGNSNTAQGANENILHIRNFQIFFFYGRPNYRREVISKIIITTSI